MESVSLEDEEMKNMFITQESRNIVPLIPNFEDQSEECEILEIGKRDAVVTDPKYSDISDDDFQIPASQPMCVPVEGGDRRSDCEEHKVKPKSLVCRGLSRLIGVNSRRKNLMKSRLAVKKAVSRKCAYLSDAKIEELEQIRLKPNSQSKVNWGVNAYNEWHDARLESFQYDIGIYYADLRDLKSLTRENLSHALCRFIPEITKQKGVGPYPGHTLYQLVKAIQKYLNINKLNWRLVEGCGKEFEDVKIVLDNTMKRTAQNIGVTERQAKVISYEDEEKLWERGILGEHNPEILRNTVLFLLGINVMLRAVYEHYNLRREMPTECSQIQFERDESGNKCLVYREDFVTEMHDGGIADRKSDCKEVWVFPP